MIDCKMNFIVGVGRSGTTLLQQMLNANPQCVATPERQFTMAFYEKYAHKMPIPTAQFLADATRYHRLLFRKQLLNNGTRADNMWEFDNDSFTRLVQQTPPPDYPQICRSFLINMYYLGRSNGDVRVIIDKNPNYTLYTNQLLTLFPDARFVVTLRDYRAVLLSHQQSKDNRYTNALFWLLLWRKHYQHILKISSCDPDRFLWLPYETLTSAPLEETTHRLCQFLGVEWHEKMLNAQQDTAEWMANNMQNAVLSERKYKKRNDLSKSIYTTRKSAWQEQLSSWQIEMADLLCGDIGLKMGYMPRKKLTLPRKIYLVLYHLPQLVYAYWAYLLYAKYYYLPLSLRFLLIKHFKFQR